MKFQTCPNMLNEFNEKRLFSMEWMFQISKVFFLRMVDIEPYLHGNIIWWLFKIIKIVKKPSEQVTSTKYQHATQKMPTDIVRRIPSKRKTVGYI